MVGGEVKKGNYIFEPCHNLLIFLRSESREGPPRSLCGLSHNAMVGEYVLSNEHNCSLTLESTTSFCPSYFAAQEASVAP